MMQLKNADFPLMRIDAKCNIFEQLRIQNSYRHTILIFLGLVHTTCLLFFCYSASY
jgi:hypothetical protein